MSETTPSTMTPAHHEPAVAASGGSAVLARLQLVSPYVALLAAWIATAGSLYFSDVLGMIPCGLCWYQRILMYPLALIIAVGILRRDMGIYLYVLPFSILGMLVAAYHYLLVKTTIFPIPPCAMGIPCTTQYINWFGFVNIPFLALVAFGIITLAMGILSTAPASEPATRPEDSAESAATAPAPVWTLIGPLIGVVGIIGSVVGIFLTMAATHG